MKYGKSTSLYTKAGAFCDKPLQIDDELNEIYCGNVATGATSLGHAALLAHRKHNEDNDNDIGNNYEANHCSTSPSPGRHSQSQLLTNAAVAAAITSRPKSLSLIYTSKQKKQKMMIPEKAWLRN
jgi:hypothetical protein